jgi:hypothetical protein
MLSAIEIEERMPLWQAFSELFRDTEMSEPEWNFLVDTLRISGLPTDMLRHILEREVAPAFYPNVLSIAGNWTGWTEDAVRSTMLAALQSAESSPLRHWLRRLVSRHYACCEWKKIETRLTSATG